MDVHRGTDRTLTPALALGDVHVHFGAVHALAGASFVARAGTIHALLGENGAGKTTLMRVAYGSVRADSGTVAVHGRAVRLESPAHALRAGIGMVHQHFTLVPAMTVAENVALGGTGWRFDAAAAAALVHEIGQTTGLILPPEERVASLSVAAQQRLEIVKALARDVQILILDEPTAVLSPLESEELLHWLRDLANAGRTVVLITHKLRDALGVADDVTVLRHGRTVLRQSAVDASPESLAEAMLGGPAKLPSHGSTLVAPGAAAARPTIVARDLEIDDERGVRRIRTASFELHAGEIIGIAAVEGSGHRELLEALAGRRAPAGGVLMLPPSIGYVPEDRQQDALVLDLSLTENVALRGAGMRRGIMPWPALERRTRELIAMHDVRTPGAHTSARALSGGNQQKLVFARELDGAPEALIAESPTRGLDIRATSAVHERLRAAARSGMCVILFTSEVDETLLLADRMLVVYQGVVREVARDRAQVGAAMVGLS